MKKILIQMIEFYQSKISPNTRAKCIFIPTCSAYAKEAIQVHGAIKGLALSAWRFLRCNPFSKGGFDPVPEKRKKNNEGEE